MVQRPHIIDSDKRSRTDGPEIFGRYRLRGVLGQGGMGRLYLAEQIGIEGFVKLIALKRILPHLADSPQFQEMFVNEARVAARLEHPNIVATYELGEVEGTYFLSMEYLPGEDLATLLARCVTAPMPVEIAAFVGQQCANGLHYAHELRDTTGQMVGLVHRDVSPFNVVVTYFGAVKLLDFGVVKGQNSVAKTAPGTFKGKYAYSSPEQIEGAPLDRTTDVFSLGTVLWECLTGRPLFSGKTDASTIDAVRSQRIDPPSAVRPDVPHDLDQIVLRALQRKSSLRYQTTHDLSEALDRFLVRYGHRPNSKSMGEWMESLFGMERATLKRSIAQGGQVENALARLHAISAQEPRLDPPGPSPATISLKPRTAWSTSFTRHGADSASPDAGPEPRTPSSPMGQPRPTPGHGFPARPTPTSYAEQWRHATSIVAAGEATPPASPQRRGPMVWWVLGGMAVIVAILPLVRGALLPSGPVEGGGASARATVDVRSTPPGAMILVDGDPSGQATPAVLAGLPVGRAIEIRLDKPGYQPAARKIEVRAQPQAQVLAFQLVEASGSLRLAGLPKGAAVYLDDNRVEGDALDSVPVGQHKLRVELADDVMYAAEIDVHAGEHTVAIDRNRRSP